MAREARRHPGRAHEHGPVGRALPDKAALLKALKEASERQPDELHLDKIIAPRDVPAASEMLLLQFVVENFLSFRDKAVLSLLRAVVGVPTRKPCRTPDEASSPEVRRYYGANASGKSNLVKALQFAQRLVVSGTKSGEPTGVTPFKLSEQADAPTRFEFELGIKPADATPTGSSRPLWRSRPSGCSSTTARRSGGCSSVLTMNRTQAGLASSSAMRS